MEHENCKGGSIVVGSLGSVTKNLDKWLGKLNVKISISLLQKTTLLGTARILRRVLELQSKKKTRRDLWS